MTERLPDEPYLAFPLRFEVVGGAAGFESPGGARDGRERHVRGQIEQVLFTHPGERLFRPEFGAGVRQLLFEPNATPLWELTRKRLVASLAEALAGEVDPRSIEVEVEGEEAELRITVRYALSRIGRQEQHRFRLGAGVGGG